VTEGSASIRPNRVALSAAALTLVLVRLAAQTPPQQQTPVFRSGTDVVPITIRVVDQKGVPVTDLTQKDITIYEDRRVRPIVGFYPQMLTPGPVVPPALVWDQRRVTGLTAATRRTFLLVLGYGRLQEPTKALDGAMKFVRDMLLPQDAVAVMAFNRATSFTTDHEAIAQVLARFKKEHERLYFEVKEYYFRSRNPTRIRARSDLEMDLDLPLGGTPPLPAKLVADIDRSLFEGVLPKAELHNTSDVLLGMDLAPPTGAKPWEHQYQFRELLYELQGLGVTLSDAVMQSSPLKLFAGVEHLRFTDGEKHLVYLGGNPPISRDGDLSKIFAARVNDARVVLDYIWTDGTVPMRVQLPPTPNLVTLPPLPRTAGCAPCRDLSELTGGAYTSVDRAEGAFAKIDQRTRVSYLIGYEPSNPAQDGKYRQVRVEVNRPNVTVQYRQGYFASEEPPPLELKEAVATMRAETAGTFDENTTGLPVKVVAAVEPARSAGPPESQTVRVDVIVDMSPVKLTTEQNLRVGELQVSVYCGDEKEKTIGEMRVRWTLRADEATLADWLRNGLRRTLRVPVTATPKFVKVVVYDPISDRTGSMTVTMGK